MEWSDILKFDPVADSPPSAADVAEKYTREIALPGLMLLHAETTSRAETAGALNLLREFSTAGRRVVLCDTTNMVVGRQLGREVVESGGATVLVSCGLSGREVGIGARDAGLELSNVVVCSSAASGTQVLLNQLRFDDTVLLLGIDEATCNVIASQLGTRFQYKPALAA